MIEDVNELLDKHNISYVDKGDKILCLCLNPSHNDRHIGSFSIDKRKRLAHCFSCGFSANIYTLNSVLGEDCRNRKFEGYKFTKSLRPKEEDAKVEYPSPKVIGRLLDPFSNKEVMEYLNSIGIISEDFIHKFGIKYTMYSEMIAENLYGNINESYTRMRERICIPITHEGKKINMECRTFIDEIPKVKYVRGCSMQTLFNFENIDKSKPVVLTESVKNLCKIWNVYPNVVAMFHAIPTKIQMEMLNQCDNLIFFADNDAGSFGEKNGKDFRKGGLQFLAENYKKDFRLCWDKRTYLKYNKETGKKEQKGYDANDCTLDEIKAHLDNAILYSEFKAKSIKFLWHNS